MWEEIYGVRYHRIQSHETEDFVDQMEKMCNAMVWCFGETASLVGDFDIAHAHDWMACKAKT